MVHDEQFDAIPKAAGVVVLAMFDIPASGPGVVVVEDALDEVLIVGPDFAVFLGGFDPNLQVVLVAKGGRGREIESLEIPLVVSQEVAVQFGLEEVIRSLEAKESRLPFLEMGDLELPLVQGLPREILPLQVPIGWHLNKAGLGGFEGNRPFIQRGLGQLGEPPAAVEGEGLGHGVFLSKIKV